MLDDRCSIDPPQRLRYSSHVPSPSSIAAHGNGLATQTSVAAPRVRARAGAERREATTFLRRHPWASLVTVLVAAGWVLSNAPIVDVVAGSTPSGVRLERGIGYILMAPVSNTLDTLTLLTSGQHWAMLASYVLLFVAWRVFRKRKPVGWLRRTAIEVGVATASLAALLAFYAFGAAAPRPMAALAVDDPDVLIVDFHSHTEHSHDGRDGFDADARRAWHAAGGFHAAYISDHRTYDGWLEAASGNPDRVGGAMTLLPAMEVRYLDAYVNALGDPARYRAARAGNNLDPAAVTRLAERAGKDPTFVLSVFEVRKLEAHEAGDRVGVVAMEMTEAAPRGLHRSRRDRALLLETVESLNVAPVSASTNHGWGRTVAAWTLMDIPGWRRMTPAQLGASIEARLHAERADASRVVERHVPYAGPSPAALATTLPTVTWNMFQELSPAERLSWLAWAWLLALVVAAGGPRRALGLARTPSRRDSST